MEVEHIADRTDVLRKRLTSNSLNFGRLHILKHEREGHGERLAPYIKPVVDQRLLCDLSTLRHHIRMREAEVQSVIHFDSVDQVERSTSFSCRSRHETIVVSTSDGKMNSWSNSIYTTKSLLNKNRWQGREGSTVTDGIVLCLDFFLIRDGDFRNSTGFDNSPASAFSAVNNKGILVMGITKQSVRSIYFGS